jgi:hypothetical protein
MPFPEHLWQMAKRARGTLPEYIVNGVTTNVCRLLVKSRYRGKHGDILRKPSQAAWNELEPYERTRLRAAGDQFYEQLYRAAKKRFRQDQTRQDGWTDEVSPHSRNVRQNDLAVNHAAHKSVPVAEPAQTATGNSDAPLPEIHLGVETENTAAAFSAFVDAAAAVPDIRVVVDTEHIASAASASAEHLDIDGSAFAVGDTG